MMVIKLHQKTSPEVLTNHLECGIIIKPQTSRLPKGGFLYE
jgi:hypothetical protein